VKEAIAYPKVEDLTSVLKMGNSHDMCLEIAINYKRFDISLDIFH